MVLTGLGTFPPPNSQLYLNGRSSSSDLFNENPDPRYVSPPRNPTHESTVRPHACGIIMRSNQRPPFVSGILTATTKEDINVQRCPICPRIRSKHHNVHRRRSHFVLRPNNATAQTSISTASHRPIFDDLQLGSYFAARKVNQTGRFHSDKHGREQRAHTTNNPLYLQNGNPSETCWPPQPPGF